MVGRAGCAPGDGGEAAMERIQSVGKDCMYRQVNIVNKASVPLLNMEVSCGGKRLSALVDSGATVSLIHESLVEPHMGLISHSDAVKLNAIGDAKGCSAGKVLSTSLKVGKVLLAEVTLVIVPKQVRMASQLVIGMDTIRKGKLIIDPGRRTIGKHMGGTAVALWQVDLDGHLESLALQSVLCVAADTVTVSKGKLEEVPVRVSCPGLLDDPALKNPGMMLFEGQQDANYMVSPGVVSKECLKVLVGAVEGKESTIHKGEVMGAVSTVLELEGEEDEDVGGWTQDRLEANVELEHLSSEERGKVMEVIKQYQHVLSSGENDIGKAKVLAHKISLYDQTPIYQKPRRFPEPITMEVERQCQELCASDIIEPSASPWASPIVPIRKKNGEIRLCVDYRRLNAKTKPERSPIPSLTESVYGLHGTNYFTSLDLIRGYYQVPLDDSSRELTAFATSRSHYQFKRLSFGLRNAPAAFQKAIQGILKEFSWKKVIVYIDDILIMGETFQEHLELVGRVLETLGRFGIKIRPSKCQWFAKTVDFLGHTISPNGIKKQAVYVQKVKDFPVPKTISQVREFLGLVNFQRKFLPHASVIQRPLSQVTGGKKDGAVIWTEEMNEAFHTLKELMVRDVELAFPSYVSEARPMELFVDASAKGAGACLRQWQDGDDRVIGYASMAFSPAQCNYSTIERELAALRWGMKSFRSFLFGVPFVVKTDHQPLVYLHQMRLVDSRLARTLEDMSDFNFSIEYVPGKENGAADALSRMGWNSNPVAEEVVEGGLPPGLVLDGEAVPGGGDSLMVSLFRCMTTQQIQSRPENVQELRRTLIQELLSSPKRYGITKLDKTLRREIRLMQHPGQLPCLEVLMVASHLYGLRVMVYFWSARPIIYRSDQLVGQTAIDVHIQCLAGVHFNPLRKGESYVPPAAVNAVGYEARSGLKERPMERIVRLVEDPNMCTRCVPSDFPKVMVNVEGRSFCAVLDLGAQVSLIRQSTLEEIEGFEEGVSSDKVQLLIVGLTGESQIIDRSVDLRVELPNDMHSSMHTFAVVPSEIIPNCFLFGIDFLADHGLAINGANGTCCQNVEATLGTSVRWAIGSALTVMQTEEVSSRGTQDELQRRGDGQGLEVGGGLETESLGSRGVGLDGQSKEGEVSELGQLVSVEVVRADQEKEGEIKELYEMVSEEVDKGEWPENLEEFGKTKASFKIKDGILYAMSQGSPEREVIVVSFGLLVGLALKIHVLMSHMGRDKMIHMLRQYLWHPKVYMVADDICRTCRECQLKKVHRQPKTLPIVKIKTARPFEMVAVDLVNFPRTRRGNIGCCVVVDHNSKWMAAVPIKNKTGQHIAQVFEERVLPFMPRKPDRVLSDNGCEFTSFQFEDVLKKYNMTHVFVTPYHAAGNGAVERVNRTIGESLKVIGNGQNWDEDLTRMVLTYNSTKHRELGMSPSRYLLAEAHNMLDSVVAGGSETGQVWRQAHPNFRPFTVGEEVVRRIPKLGHAVTNKFAARYEGPLTVDKVHQNGLSYELKRMGTGQIIRAHHKQLYVWYSPPSYLRDHPVYGSEPGGIRDQESDSSEVRRVSLDSSSSRVSSESSTLDSEVTSGEERGAGADGSRGKRVTGVDGNGRERDTGADESGSEVDGSGEERGSEVDGSGEERDIEVDGNSRERGTEADGMEEETGRWIDMVDEEINSWGVSEGILSRIDETWEVSEQRISLPSSLDSSERGNGAEGYPRRRSLGTSLVDEILVEEGGAVPSSDGSSSGEFHGFEESTPVVRGAAESRRDRAQEGVRRRESGLLAGPLGLRRSRRIGKKNGEKCDVYLSS